MKPSQKIIFIALFIFLSFSLLMPALVYAQNPGEIGPDVGGTPSGQGGTTSLPNPLGKDVNDPRVIIGNVIKVSLGIVGSLALAVFIFGGFTWVIAAGNEERIKKGKEMIMWAALGLIVIFLSYALVDFVLGAITGTTGAPKP